MYRFKTFSHDNIIKAKNFYITFASKHTMGLSSKVTIKAKYNCQWRLDISLQENLVSFSEVQLILKIYMALFKYSNETILDLSRSDTSA